MKAFESQPLQPVLGQTPTQNFSASLSLWISIITIITALVTLVVSSVKLSLKVSDIKNKLEITDSEIKNKLEIIDLKSENTLLRLKEDFIRIEHNVNASIARLETTYSNEFENLSHRIGSNKIRLDGIERYLIKVTGNDELPSFAPEKTREI